MDQHKMKIISFLLVMALLSGLLSGCSQGSASAQVNDKLELAVKYLSENKYDEAILAYQEVIKIDSMNVTAYKGISLAYVLQEKPDQAEQALQNGLKAVPQNTHLQLAMAGLMVDQGKNDQAEAIYKELVGGASTSLSSYQAYSDYLNKQGKNKEAVAMLEQAAAKNSQDYQLNSLLARLYIDNGENAKASASIDQSLNQQTDQSEAYQLLEKLYANHWAELSALGDQYIQQNQTKIGQLMKMTALYNLGNYGELITQFENLPAAIKSSAKARLLAAQAYLKLGNPDQAGNTIKAVQVADLKDAGMLAEIASYYLNAGDKDNARKLALKGIALNESLSDNYLVIYQSYLDENSSMQKYWSIKYRLASNLSSKQVNNELNLMIAHAYVDKANAIRDKNATRSTDPYASALAYYQKAIDIAPSYYEAYTNRAITYNSMEEWGKGLSDCNKAIELDPNNARAYNLRAWTDNSGFRDYVKAREDALKAIALDSDNYEAYNQLSVSYMFQGQYDKAIEAANAGITINPDYCWCYEDLGWAYMSLRQYDKAKLYILKASEFNETRAKASQNLETLQTLGY